MRRSRSGVFVIVSAPRCGSSHLVEALNEHPYVAANGELFNDLDRDWEAVSRAQMSDAHLLRLAFKDFPLRPSRSVEARHRDDVRAVGIKLSLHYPELPARGSFMRALAALPDLKVIVLRRDNQLESFRSLLQAERTGVWRRYNNVSTLPDAAPPVDVEPEPALAWFLRVEAFYRLALDLLPDHPRLELKYEDLFDRPSAVLAAAYDFLGVCPFEPKFDMLIKLESRGLDQTVSNFQQLAHALAGTPYRRFVRLPGDDPDARAER